MRTGSACRKTASREEQDGPPIDVFGDRAYDSVHPDLDEIDIAGYGYRWIRLRRTIGGRAGSSRPA